MQRVRLLAVLALVVVVLPACDGDIEAKSYGSSERLLDAMQDGGVSCSPQHSEEVKLARDFTRCEIDQQRATIATFEDGGALEDYVAIRRGFANLVVRGPNWVVTVEDKPTAERIQETIGGEIE